MALLLSIIVLFSIVVTFCYPILIEQCLDIFGFVITLVADCRIRKGPAVTKILQCPFRDMKYSANFSIVYSSALGSRIEMAVKSLHYVGHSAGVGLQIRPCAFFD